ncbi:MAG: hypothetical protein GXX79_05175 [Actinomycetales bacterium]|nr:hypothetical protein [Actinomycetales bacterium]
MDGPVVMAAVRALDAGEVNLVLPYVPLDGEDEVRDAFARVCAARTVPEVRDLADQYFFETVVRIHRAGEGAPYTGLRPAGLGEGPVIPVARRAVTGGSAEELVTVLSDLLREEVARRFQRVMELRQHADGPVPLAREYVEAVLGLQVWSHQLHLAMAADPHGDHGHAPLQ